MSLSIYASLHISIYPSFHLSSYQSVHISIYESIHLSIHLFIYLFNFLAICHIWLLYYYMILFYRIICSIIFLIICLLITYVIYIYKSDPYQLMNSGKTLAPQPQLSNLFMPNQPRNWWIPSVATCLLFLSPLLFPSPPSYLFRAVFMLISIWTKIAGSAKTKFHLPFPIFHFPFVSNQFYEASKMLHAFKSCGAQEG